MLATDNNPPCHFNKFKKLADILQSLVLLFTRVMIGYSFYVAGKGKFENMEQSLGWFKTLEFPFPLSIISPELNWQIAANTEFYGGLLLLFGLGSRLISLPLAFTMVIAFITADADALKALLTWTKPSDFVGAAPFPYLLGALVVLAFGPGKISIDNLLKKFCCKK